MQSELTRRNLWTELSLVLGVSLGASAIYSLLQLFETAMSSAGLAGSSTALNQSESNSEYFDLTYQLLNIGLALVPVALAIYFLKRDKSESFSIGLFLSAGSNTLTSTVRDLVRALCLAALIGIPGLALYAIARHFGLAVQVVAATANTFWWTIPVLLLSALKSAVVEEAIMIGFVFRRLELLGFSFAKRNVLSAAIRGCYHAYQGLGGAVGNFILGLAFGWCYRRWGRVAPLVIAHFILDAVVFVGFALLSKQLTSLGW